MDPLIADTEVTCDEIENLRTHVAELETALTAELNNRCCGNCYFSTLLNHTSMGCNGRAPRVITQKNDPACEFWRSCRGHR